MHAALTLLGYRFQPQTCVGLFDFKPERQASSRLGSSRPEVYAKPTVLRGDDGGLAEYTPAQVGVRAAGFAAGLLSRHGCVTAVSRRGRVTTVV